MFGSPVGAGNAVDVFTNLVTWRDRQEHGVFCDNCTLQVQTIVSGLVCKDRRGRGSLCQAVSSSISYTARIMNLQAVAETAFIKISCWGGLAIVLQRACSGERASAGDEFALT